MRARRGGLALLMVALGGSVSAPPAHAHKASDAYLSLDISDGGIIGQWDISLRDLELAVGVDKDGDGAITWAELKAARGAIEAYTFSHLSLFDGIHVLDLTPTGLLYDRHVDGGYAVLRFSADAPVATSLTVDYSLLFELDAQHRGLLKVSTRGASQATILSLEQPRARLDLGAVSRSRQLAAFVSEGMWHIWRGTDHILFLLALLLPTVLSRVPGGFAPLTLLGPALRRVSIIVTAFTVAHSVTLATATLGLARPPSRLVESLIAASILVAVANIYWPLPRGREWLVAFGFGLIHGFGFASVLTDLGLESGTLALALLGFNVGVELGQLLIVLAFVSLAWWVRDTRLYQVGVIRGGSVVISAAALVWLVERALDVRLLP